MSSRAVSRSAKARAAELRKRLNDASSAYYVDDEPIMSDAEFDRLYDELVALEEAHPELVSPDSPTQRVGTTPSDRFRKVEHLAPMGSLEKVTSDETLAKFADDVRKRLGTEESVAYLVEPKIDGLAVSLLYENGVYTRGATRVTVSAARTSPRTCGRSVRFRSL
jgi:DNA ligase (NAD+)